MTGCAGGAENTPVVGPVLPPGGTPGLALGGTASDPPDGVMRIGGDGNCGGGACSGTGCLSAWDVEDDGTV